MNHLTANIGITNKEVILGASSIIVSIIISRSVAERCLS